MAASPESYPPAIKEPSGVKEQALIPTISQTQSQSSLCLDLALGPWALPFAFLDLKYHSFAALLLFVLPALLNVKAKGVLVLGTSK